MYLSIAYKSSKGLSFYSSDSFRNVKPGFPSFKQQKNQPEETISNSSSIPNVKPSAISDPK